MRAWRPPGRLWAPCGPKVAARSASNRSSWQPGGAPEAQKNAGRLSGPSWAALAAYVGGLAPSWGPMWAALALNQAVLIRECPYGPSTERS